MSYPPLVKQLEQIKSSQVQSVMIQSNKQKPKNNFLKLLLASDSEFSCMPFTVSGKYDVTGFV